MSTPFEWAILATAVGSGTYSGVTSYQQGKNQQKIADYNAAAAKRAAEDQRQATLIRASQLSEEGEKLRARQIESYMSSGVSLKGTPTDVLIQSIQDLEKDKQALIASGYSRAGAYDTQARIFGMEGDAALARGRSGAIGSLLETGRDVAYLGYKSGQNKDAYLARKHGLING